MTTCDTPQKALKIYELTRECFVLPGMGLLYRACLERMLHIMQPNSVRSPHRRKRCVGGRGSRKRRFQDY